MAKLIAADASWAAADMCVQTHGGFGFAEEYDIERKFRETRLYQVAPISTNMILSYLAEHVLGLPVVLWNIRRLSRVCHGRAYVVTRKHVAFLEMTLPSRPPRRLGRAGGGGAACTCRLADAGARVIKVERPEGDFAATTITSCTARARISSGSTAARSRSCSTSASPTTRRCWKPCSPRPTCSCRTSSPAPSAKLGLPVARLRQDYPRLICCSISGYGESGPYAQRKAYDLLIQAESGRRR